MPPQVDQLVNGQHAEAAAVGQDQRGACLKNGFCAPERLGGCEHLVEIGDAQQAGAAKRGLIDGVRAGERAGVRRGGLRTLRMAARLDHHDRLGARRRPRGGHELARVVDGFDVEQDGAGRAVDREVVETIAEIDIDVIAERDHGGEAHVALRRPFHETGCNSTRLRNEGEVSGVRAPRREAGVEPAGRREHA